jgi:hypothetical protein
MHPMTALARADRADGFPIAIDTPDEEPEA